MIIFNFVINYPDSELSAFKGIRNLSTIAADNSRIASKIFSRGDLAWCLQAYLNLSKNTSLEVKCSNKLLDGAINIVHSDTVLNLTGNENHFIVCVQADYPRRAWSHYHIVQNKNQVFRNTSYIPHWVQPGIIKRDESRTGVKRVGYSGQTFNKNLAGSTDTWKAMLEPYGIEFVTLSNDSWHDLKSIDVLIGIRSFDHNLWNNKPPSKLFNAWHAEIPFIGGNDSAFKQVGKSGEDYLCVTTQQDAINAILRLQNDPNLYNTIVQNGKVKALQYTEASITQIWQEVLTKPVQERFMEWKKRPVLERIRFGMIRNYGLFEHEFKQVVKTIISGGF